MSSGVLIHYWLIQLDADCRFTVVQCINKTDKFSTYTDTYTIFFGCPQALCLKTFVSPANSCLKTQMFKQDLFLICFVMSIQVFASCCSQRDRSISFTSGPAILWSSLRSLVATATDLNTTSQRCSDVETWPDSSNIQLIYRHPGTAYNEIRMIYIYILMIMRMRHRSPWRMSGKLALCRRVTASVQPATLWILWIQLSKELRSTNIDLVKTKSQKRSVLVSWRRTPNWSCYLICIAT